MKWLSPTRGASSAEEFLLRLRSTEFSVLGGEVHTPLSDVRVVVLAAAVYLAVIASLRRRAPPKFASSRPFVALALLHNAALSAASLAMLVGVVRAVAADARAPASAWRTVCLPRGETMSPAVTRWLYVFYATKFWELADTVLLVLRGRPLTVLHVWHHTSVMFEIFSWLESQMVLGAYGMMFNCLVHVLMYAYYAAALLRIRVPWKKSLTTLQIVQFCVSLASLFPYVHAARSTESGCTGQVGILVSIVCNVSFLALFLDFYRKTYSQRRPVRVKSE